MCEEVGGWGGTEWARKRGGRGGGRKEEKKGGGGFTRYFQHDSISLMLGTHASSNNDLIVSLCR